MTTPAAGDHVALPSGTLLNQQYQVDRVLGAPGAFGITYLAYDRSLGIWVAIKEFLPLDLAGRAPDRTSVAPHSGQRDLVFQDGLGRFLNEAQALARIDHPNVVRVRNFFREHGTAYLVMDYYKGTTLKEHLGAIGGRLPWAIATELILHVLDGLSAVHRAGMIHRDLKPSNVYLTKDGRPVILDFGAARVTRPGPGGDLTSILTAGYAPLEQYGTRGQGPWTDVYAAAALLYHLVTGSRPPDATDRLVDDPLTPPQATAKDLPPGVANVILAGLTLHAKGRPQDAPAFQEMLERAAADRRPRRAPSVGKSAVAPVSREVPPSPDGKRTTVMRSTDSTKTRAVLLVVIGILALMAAAWLASIYLRDTGNPSTFDSAMNG